MFAPAPIRTGALARLSSQQLAMSSEQLAMVESQRALLDDVPAVTQQDGRSIGGFKRVPLPALPYYGLLSQLAVEVSDSLIADQAVAEANLFSSNSAASRKLLERCSYYHFGADLNQMGAASAAALSGHDGGRYVDAMCDAYKRLLTSWRQRLSSSGKRPRDDDAADFTGFFVLCREHIHWHNWAAMFFIEGKALCVMVASDSPTFRRVLQEEALEVGVSKSTLQWVDGAVFAQYYARESTARAPSNPSEEQQRPPQPAINEVAALFDIILNLNLIVAETSAPGDDAIPPGIAQPFATGAPVTNSGLLTVLSSFPFLYGEWRQMRLSVADPVIVFAADPKPNSCSPPPPALSSASPSQGGVFQRRRRWVVTGGPSFAVLPHTLGGLIKILQRDVGLPVFTIVCGSNSGVVGSKELNVRAPAAVKRGAPISLTDSQHAGRRRGPTAGAALNVATCFSRLSAQSWIDANELGAQVGGAEECEFVPLRITCFSDGMCELSLAVLRIIDGGAAE